MFRNRFKPFEFENSDEDKNECISIILFELGISNELEESGEWDPNQNFLRLFPIFYQVHVPKNWTDTPDDRIKKVTELFPQNLEVFDKFNQKNLDVFMEDAVCLKLIQHVFNRFQDLYMKQIKSTLKTRVRKFLSKILSVSNLS